MTTITVNLNDHGNDWLEKDRRDKLVRRLRAISKKHRRRYLRRLREMRVK